MPFKQTLKENSFQVNGENYLQIHGTAMGTKLAVAFANLFIGEIERNCLMEENQAESMETLHRRHFLFMPDVNRQDIHLFIEEGIFHPAIKCTAKISERGNHILRHGSVQR